MPLPIIDPIVPNLAKHVPVGDEWAYEAKLDGFRGTLYVEDRRGWFRSKRKNIMKRFQPLADSLARTLRVNDLILDGEIVVMRRHTPDFYALMFRRGTPEYAAFDLLWLNGHDLRPLRYDERKGGLRALLNAQVTISCVDSHPQPELFEAAQRLDLEGIVAKRVSDPYHSRRRG
jgi:bifunctional non-homologous end joining protein LigD